LESTANANQKRAEIESRAAVQHGASNARMDRIEETVESLSLLVEALVTDAKIAKALDDDRRRRARRKAEEPQ
jgi:hypothetical protein